MPGGAEAMERKQESPREEAEATPDRKGVVLLAEDDKAQRTLLTRQLTRMGLNVVPTWDGREALASFRDQRASVDIAILDVDLPHISGQCVFEEIRRDDPSVPVIMISGDEPAQLLRRFRMHPPDDVIQKPICLGVLKQSIQRCMAMRKEILVAARNP